MILKFVDFIKESSDTHQMPVGYHVSPAHNHDNIMKKGLQHKSGKVYVWKHRKDADWFADLHRSDGKDMHVYRVNTHGLNLKKDHETDDMSEWSSQYKSGEDGHGYIHHGKIAPDRIQKI